MTDITFCSQGPVEPTTIREGTFCTASPANLRRYQALIDCLHNARANKDHEMATRTVDEIRSSFGDAHVETANLIVSVRIEHRHLTDH
jgi:hypothetical protein